MKLVYVLLIWTGLANADHLSPWPYWGACAHTHWPCGGGTCLPMTSKCNGVRDCLDGSDEYLCAPPLLCTPGHLAFNLDNGLSIIIPANYEHDVNGNTLTIVFNGEPTHMIRCGRIPIIDHGNISLIGKDSSFGAIADVTCAEGFQSCRTHVRCLPSGTWEIAHCAPLPSQAFECYTCKNKRDNDECNKKIVGCGEDKKACQTIVKWSRNVPKVTKRCRQPAIAFGNVGCKEEGNKTICRYGCSETRCNELIPTNCQTCSDNTDDGSCELEHGSCNKRIHRRTPTLALRSLNCEYYCQCSKQCTHQGDCGYRWQKRECPTGTLFDDSLHEPTCNVAGRVYCHGVAENECSREHGICNEKTMVKSPTKVLSNSQCVKYCRCVIEQSLYSGSPVFTWSEEECPANQAFHRRKGKCILASKIKCRN